MMEKKRSVGVKTFLLPISLICLFIFLTPNLYSQVPAFNYAVESNPELRAKLEYEIEIILQSEGFDVKSVKITVEGERKLYKKVIANVQVALLEKDIKRIKRYIATIKEAISKEMPNINIYRISFTLEVSP